MTSSIKSVKFLLTTSFCQQSAYHPYLFFSFKLEEDGSMMTVMTVMLLHSDERAS